MKHFRVREICPVCAAPDARTIYRAAYAAPPVRGFLESQYAMQGRIDWSLLEDADYEVAHCPVCDLVFQKTVPDDVLLEHLYTEMISPEFLEPHERALITLDSYEKIAGELAVLFRLTGKPPTEIALLDYGFGFGRWARVARGMGARVFATEIGEDKRRYAATLGVEIVEDAAIDTMRFDIVHTEQVFEHLTEPGRDFRRLARAAERLFKVAIPGRGDVIGLLERQGLPPRSAFALAQAGERVRPSDEAIAAIQPLEHLNAYSSRTLAWLAREAGLELASRVRRGTVGLDLTAPGRLARSVAKAGVMAAKMIVRPDHGYYLFRKQ